MHFRAVFHLMKRKFEDTKGTIKSLKQNKRLTGHKRLHEKLKLEQHEPYTTEDAPAGKVTLVAFKV